MIWSQFCYRIHIFFKVASLELGQLYDCRSASYVCFNILRLRLNGRHFADDTLTCIFLNESVWLLNEISLNIVPNGLMNNIPALVQIMACCRTGDKPLFEPMLIRLLMHICITWPQWVNDMDEVYSLPDQNKTIKYNECRYCLVCTGCVPTNKSHMWL